MTEARWHVPYTANKLVPPGTFAALALGDEATRRVRCAVRLEEQTGVDVTSVEVVNNDLHARVEIVAVFDSDDLTPPFPRYLISTSKAVDA